MVTLPLQLSPTSPVNIKPPIFRLRFSPFSLFRLNQNELNMHKKIVLPVCSSLPMSNFQHPHQSPSDSPPENQVAAILFGNGSEAKLCPLTRRRSAGAIPLGANYRLIDAVVSNCINSNINKIFALTQFNSTSLNSHLSRAYSNMGLGKEGFIEVIAACQSPGNNSWFQGNADAVRRFLWMLEEYPVKEFLVLPGYHLYQMDYQEILQFHRRKRADITIAALSFENREDKGFSILKINSEGQVLDVMTERETKFPKLRRFEDVEDNRYTSVASMGIYVINKHVMVKILTDYLPWAHDFRSEVIPGAISLGMKVQAYLFDGYWENMGSIKTFYLANMEIIKTTNIRYDFYDTVSPLYTLPRRVPPTRVTDAVIMNSVVGEGCILNQCKIKGSVVGLRTRIEDGVVIEDSILMGSDTYREDLQETNMDRKKHAIPIGIGQASLIQKAIVDKNARIGKEVMITNKDNVQEASREDQGYVIQDSIVVIISGAVIPDGSII